MVPQKFEKRTAVKTKKRVSWKETYSGYIICFALAREVRFLVKTLTVKTKHPTKLKFDCENQTISHFWSFNLQFEFRYLGRNQAGIMTVWRRDDQNSSQPFLEPKLQWSEKMAARSFRPQTVFSNSHGESQTTNSAQQEIDTDDRDVEDGGDARADGFDSDQNALVQHDELQMHRKLLEF